MKQLLKRRPLILIVLGFMVLALPLDIYFKNRANFHWAEFASRIVRTRAADLERRAEGENGYQINCRLNHINFAGMDIVGDVALRADMNKGPEAAAPPDITGTLAVSTLILNYKPFWDIGGSYRLSRDTLTLIDVRIGPSLTISGTIGLNPSHEIALELVLKDMDVNKALSFLDNPNFARALSGTVNGTITLRGPLYALQTKGRLIGTNGNFLHAAYTSADITIAGIGPVIQFIDSRIQTEKGFLLVQGSLDFAQLGKNRFFEKARVASLDESKIWVGWDIEENKSSDDVKLGRNLNEALRLNVERPNPAGVPPAGRAAPQEKGKVEVEYQLEGEKSVKVGSDGDSSFVGMEQKNKF